MKAVWIGAVALLVICATEVPAFACSCSRVLTFEEEFRERSIVVVGKVTSRVPHRMIGGAQSLLRSGRTRSTPRPTRITQ